MKGLMRVAIVTNIPAPYRLPIYELLAEKRDLQLGLFFCNEREPDREWNLAQLKVPHVFLRGYVLRWRERFVHTNPGVWSALSAFQPDVVVTTGFNPTHLLAFAFARMRGVKHVAMTDGTAVSESALTFMHRWVRRWVYGRTQAFVGASEGSLELYRRYGVSTSATFKSHLCANNPAFTQTPRVPREFDFIFCGRFAEGKLPLFAIDVAERTARQLGRRVRLLLVGSGPLEARMREQADLCAEYVKTHFVGFARQAELPAHYARAKLMLFPTVGDTWGVVANEACAAGVPVLVSQRAGVAGDLVVDQKNGRVLPLDAAQWAEAAAELLRNEPAWQRMSASARAAVEPYTYANAAAGLADAIALATRRKTEEAKHD